MSKPLVIWGASVGPFSKNLAYEKYIASHLKRVTAIFARESSTISYLDSIGVSKNVWRTADPAFWMSAVKPTDEFLPEPESIGVNLSPLMSRYVSDGNIAKWTNISAELIKKLVSKTGRKVYLVPHVTVPNSNDSEFLEQVMRVVSRGSDVELVSDKYSAAELKYIIGSMSAFAGARTHSTIAALSSYVPTLSLAYSLKARGINEDIFGHSDYSLEPGCINPDSFVEKMLGLIASKNKISTTLREKIPRVVELAYSAGLNLKKILG